ncbi:MAG: M28 family peptidase [Verrucomicrobia bacterium]|nr:M28 family peptidase [Verrucomicrobiota bacterium]
MNRHGRLFVTCFSLVILSTACRRPSPPPEATKDLAARAPDNQARVEPSPETLSPDGVLATAPTPARRPATPMPEPSVTLTPPPAVSIPIPPGPVARRAPIWKEFDGQLALTDAGKFVAFGPRPSGSAALDRERAEIAARLNGADWQVSTAAFTDQTPDGSPVDFRSLGARFRRGQPAKKRFLLVAHFDTERSKLMGTSGATDGAAGPAILLEIARVLAAYPQVASQVELLFLDGNHPFRQSTADDGLFGSRFAVQMLQLHQRSGEIRAVIDLENLGGKDFRLYYPPNSDPDLAETFQRSAGILSVPLAAANRPVLGDQVPFQQANIPAIALLDTESPYLHTADDNLDRVDPASLAKVGQLVLYVLSEEIFPSGL